jgi:hypothetical protein
MYRTRLAVLMGILLMAGGPCFSAAGLTEEQLKIQAKVDKLTGVTTPMTPDDVNLFIELVTLNAQAYIADEPEQARIDGWMYDSARYSPEGFETLAAFLESLRDPQHELYIANRLLYPAKRFTDKYAAYRDKYGKDDKSYTPKPGDVFQDPTSPTPEMASRLADVIEQIKRRHKFRMPPQLSGGALKRLQMPDPALSAKLNGAALMKMIAKVQLVRDKKRQLERPIMINNNELWNLEENWIYFRVLIDDWQEDQKLLEQALAWEKEHFGLFAVVYKAYAKAAKEDFYLRDRATQLYDIMQTHREELDQRHARLQEYMDAHPSAKDKNLHKYKTYLTTLYMDQSTTVDLWSYSYRKKEMEKLPVSVMNNLAKRLDKKPIELDERKKNKGKK